MARKIKLQTTTRKPPPKEPPDSGSPVKARKDAKVGWGMVNKQADRAKVNRKAVEVSGRARSAVTGRFVKKDYATKHPKTTIVERTKELRSKKARKK